MLEDKGQLVKLYKDKGVVAGIKASREPRQMRPHPEAPNVVTATMKKTKASQRQERQTMPLSARVPTKQIWPRRKGWARGSGQDADTGTPDAKKGKRERERQAEQRHGEEHLEGEIWRYEGSGSDEALRRSHDIG